MLHFMTSASLIEVYAVLIKTKSNYLTTSFPALKNLQTLELEK